MSTKPVLSTPIQSKQPVPSSNYFPFKGCAEVTASKFNQLFNWDEAKKVATDEQKFSDKQSVISVEIGDCITIFGMVYSEEKGITEISAYHPQNGTEKKEIKDYIDGFEKGKSYFFIIGGNDATVGEVGLLTNIHLVIEKHFGDTSCILGELTNLNAKTTYNYITAGLNMEGLLAFYRHNTE